MDIECTIILTYCFLFSFFLYRFDSLQVRRFPQSSAFRHNLSAAHYPCVLDTITYLPYRLWTRRSGTFTKYHDISSSYFGVGYSFFKCALVLEDSAWARLRSSCYPNRRCAVFGARKEPALPTDGVYLIWSGPLLAAFKSYIAHSLRNKEIRAANSVQLLGTVSIQVLPVGFLPCAWNISQLSPLW